MFRFRSTSSLRGPRSLGCARPFLGAAAALAFSGAACGDYGDPPLADTGGEEVGAGAPRALRAGHYREYKDDYTAMSELGMRLVGVNPDQTRHPGMIDIADQLGFAYADDECGAGFQTTFKNGEFVASADHSVPGGSNCGGSNYNTAVATTYKFRDWRVDPKLSFATPHPFDTIPTIPKGEGNHVTQDTPNVDPKTGEVSVDEHHVILADGDYSKLPVGSGGGGPMTALIPYQVSIAHTTGTSWSKANSVGFSVGLKVKSGIPLIGGDEVEYKFDYNHTETEGESTTNMKTETFTPTCSFTANVPAGCHYRGELTATVKRVRQAYWADVTVRPQTASLAGFMRYEQGGGCQHKYFRNGDGKCPCNEELVHKLGGSCQNARATFQADFGTPGEGLYFLDEIINRRKDDKGLWYWWAAATTGTAMDEAIAALRDETDRYQFSLPFVYADDQLLMCSYKVTVVEGSDPSCSEPKFPDKPLVEGHVGLGAPSARAAAKDGK